MSEEEINRDYSEMWTEQIMEYALVREKDFKLGYTIMDTKHNGMVIIEKDEIAQYVIKKMLENGVSVVDDFEKVRNPNPPDPIFYTPELEAQYRKWQEQQKNKKGKNKK